MTTPPIGLPPNASKELLELVLAITKECQPLLDARDHATVLSALGVVFALAAANKAFAEGDSEEEDWKIAGQLVAQFNRFMPTAISQHFSHLRGMLATALPAVPETKQ